MSVPRTVEMVRRQARPARRHAGVKPVRRQGPGARLPRMTLPPALQTLLVDFEPAIREMAQRLHGVELLEAASREYEFVMAWTPPQHQDEAHDLMLGALVRHGIVQRPSRTH